MLTSNLALSPKQLCSIEDAKSQKIALWVGAVSAGKTLTSLFALFFAIHHTTGRGEIVIVGKTLQTIERNIIKQMQSVDLFGELANEVVHTRGAGTATILGREVHLVGANDAGSETKIRGLTVELAYVDEATLLPPSKDGEPGFWDMLITRLRVPGARLLATTNPGSSQHWLRLNYMLDAKAKNMIVFHFTMDDNPSLTDDYRRDMYASFSGIFFDRFILGLWTNAEGAIFDGWSPAKHVVEWGKLPPMVRLLGVGMDFGTQHATSAVVLGLGYDRKLYLVDELRLDVSQASQTFSPSQQASAIKKWLKTNHLPYDSGLTPEYLFSDPAALAWRRELQVEGVDTVGADNDVMYSIGLISSLLARGLLMVADRCAGVVKEMPGYIWDAKKAERGIEEPVKANDDSIDAFRYVVTSTEFAWRDELQTTLVPF